MTKFILALTAALATCHAHATVWFGFTDSDGNPVVVGLSSGPITIAESDKSGYVGHLRLSRHFLGIGAYPLDRYEFEKARELELESQTSEEFLAKLETEFPDRRFLIGADDGKILMTAGHTGCNATNVYCGYEQSGSFHIVGGGLIDQNVLVNPMHTFNAEAAHASANALACKIVDSILGAGGEIKDFYHGVIWTKTAHGETLLREVATESELIPKLKSQYCP